MQREMAWLQRIIPEMIELLEKRYNILRYLSHVQPIGRRSLSKEMDMGERIIRKELDFLRSAGLLEMTSGGMALSQEGVAILASLEKMVHEFRGLTALENQLMLVVKAERIFIVPGDVDYTPAVKVQLARKVGEVLLSVLPEHKILAVTGGTTIAAVAEHLPHNVSWQGKVVPCRGGTIEQAEFQSNWVAAKLASVLGAECRMLHVPEKLEEDLLARLLQNPGIQEVHQLIKSADVVLHGIGDACLTAQKRGFSSTEVEELLARGAVGESLGCYFNIGGDVVQSTGNIGLKPEDLAKAEHVIAVAGGKCKAKAILAVGSYQYMDWLVTDEGAAREILAISRRLGAANEVQFN